MISQKVIHCFFCWRYHCKYIKINKNHVSCWW